MQGQRGGIGSFAETLDFDHGTTSNNAAVDQHNYWNHTRNPAENLIPNYILSPSDTNIAVMNSNSHERPNLSRWCLGEPSSSNTEDEFGQDEQKTEFNWSSSVSPCAMSGPMFEESRYESTNNLSVDNNMSPMFTQGSNSDAIPQNLNLNAGIVDHSGNTNQALECPNTYKSIRSENEQIRPASGSASFLFPEENPGLSMGGNDVRPGSLDGRRLSYKRKAIEGNSGQSSAAGSSSYLWHNESSARPGVSARYSSASSLSISAASEEANPRLGLGGREVTSGCVPDSSVAGSSRSSHRNFRVRINPSYQHNSISPSIFPSVTTVRHSIVSSLPPYPTDPTLDLRPTSTVNNMNFQSQPVAISSPSLPQNVQSLGWSGGSTSRAGSSSTSGVYGDRDALREELVSRSLARNMLDHPIFVPATDMGNVLRHQPTRSLTGGNSSVAGNVASTSRTGSGSFVHPPTAPTWLPDINSIQHHPRRLSEIVRRSLFFSAGTDSGVPGSLPLRVGHPSSSQDMFFTSGAVNQGHHQSHPRSASWLERHNDGVHYSRHGLAAASEGSNRLVSEIRNVLGLMRRRENLRIEDVMLLDQSVFFGVADMHDRHRDMRLDVDNMSYEELLALEERIGNVSTGLSEETVVSHLKHKLFSVPVGSQCETEPCCICQEEYNEGEDLGRLQCGHDFHSHCIKQWLMHKNICPICKTTGLAA